MPKSLLVADDSVTIQKVIGMIFAAEDFQITSVDNGLEAISKARELRPDLVLADVTMPGRSGYEVCEALKTDPDTQTVPVLLLAGTFEPFDENRARSVRADDYIVKPFESQALLDKVRTLTGVPRPAETPRQVFTAESSGARPIAPPSAPSRVPPAAGTVPASSTSFPGSGGPPRPSAPAYSLGQSSPARPGAPVPPSGLRPTAPMPVSQLGGTRPMSPVPRPSPAYSTAGQGAASMAQYRPPPGAIPRPGPMVAAPGGVPGVGATGYQPRSAPAAAQPIRGQVPIPAQGLPRPVPIPRGSLPPAGPAPGQRQPQAAPPLGSSQPSRFGEAPPAPRPAQAPMGARADGGEALLREALSKASREVIEKIVWEVVPQLAETIIRENLDRLAKDRQGRN